MKFMQNEQSSIPLFNSMFSLRIRLKSHIRNPDVHATEMAHSTLEKIREHTTLVQIPGTTLDYLDSAARLTLQQIHIGTCPEPSFL